MGPSASKDSKPLEQFHNRFRVVKEFADRNVSYLEEKQTHRPYLLKETTFNDQEEFNRAISKVVIKQKELEGQAHVAALSEYFTKTEDNFCSNFYKLYVLFEYPHKTLADEIAERQERNSKFQEKEMWSILASCILGLCHLQNAHIKHQALRTDVILLTSEGSILVADPYCTGQQSNYETLLNQRSTPHIYLSPEQCKALHEEKLNPTNINPYKSDVFTLGMIMLEAGLLSSQDDCYREDCSVVNWEALQYNLQRFGQNYSHELKAMLEMMLNQNEDERLVWIELETYVRSDGESESMERIQTPTSRPSDPFIPIDNAPAAAPQPTSTQPPQVNSAQQTLSASATAQLPSTQRSMFRQLGGGGATASNTVSQFQQPPTTETIYTSNVPTNPPQNRATQSAIPAHQQFITTTQVLNRTQPPQPINQIPEGPAPVPPSAGGSARPLFNQHVPANSYNTLTKVDENLVEIDEEDLTQTREPDDAAVQRNPPVANVQGSNFNETATIRSTFQPPQSQPQPASNYVSAPPMQFQLNGYQISNPPGYQLLQQPTEAQKFATWQSSISQNVVVAPQNTTFQSLPPLPIGGSSTAPLAATFRPPQPISAIPNYQPSSAYQYSYIAPVNTTAPVPPVNYSTANYPPPTFSTRPVPAYDFTRVAPPQNQFVNYQPKTNDIGAIINQQRLNNARLTESFDASSTNRALNEPEVQFVKETFKQGSYYEGEKVNGMRHGRGKFYYTDGGLYDGEWRQNKMSGQGKLYYQSGKIAYDGAWTDDKFTGFGVLYNEAPLTVNGGLDYTNFEQVDEYWTKFEGEFYDDLKQGPGRLYLSNGEYFEGEFDKDTASGEGCYHRLNGEKVRGIWNQNILTKRLS